VQSEGRARGRVLINFGRAISRGSPGSASPSWPQDSLLPGFARPRTEDDFVREEGDACCVVRAISGSVWSSFCSDTGSTTVELEID
jgi:hypothetical protein